MTLEVSQLEILGKDDNDGQLKNIEFVSITFEVFHFDISGKDDNDLHPSNILFILIILKKIMK